MAQRKKTLEYTKSLNLRHDASDPYKELANAIVEVAADDYRYYMAKKCENGPSMSDLELRVLDGNIHGIQVFFESGWGFLLSHGLAPVILKRLHDEFAEKEAAVNNQIAIRRKLEAMKKIRKEEIHLERTDNQHLADGPRRNPGTGRL